MIHFFLFYIEFSLRFALENTYAVDTIVLDITFIEFTPVILVELSRY